MKRKDLGVDPEYHRYRRSYPRFPGVKKAVELLHRAKGGYLESVWWDLAEHVAAAGTAELAAAFRTETDSRVRSMMLEAIAAAPMPADLALFVEALSGDDDGLYSWAARGLRRLATPEAKRALWQASTRTFADPAKTARFREMLDSVKRGD